MEDDGRVAKDSDELLRLMEEDELADGLVTQTHMAISDYARARHVTPQLVHYYIRNKRLKKHKCACGRYVVNIEEADIAMKFKEPPKDEKLATGREDGEEDGEGTNSTEAERD